MNTGRLQSSNAFQAVDVASESQVEPWAARLLSSNGSPDLLINNAAVINQSAPLWQVPAEEFDRVIGLKKLLCFHLNDSLKPWGSRVDRHAHIGRGELGTEPFRLLVNDRRFRNRPMILETPKEEGDNDDMDTVNLQALRELCRE